MILYRILMAINLLVVVGVIVFFVWGLTDGSVGSYNMSLWNLILAGTIALPCAGWFLRRHGRPGLANLVLAVLVVPAVVAIVMVIAVILNPPRWI